MKIAVVGSGISGLVAAYLLAPKHEVQIFEKNDYVGGHTNTRIVRDASGNEIPVDTGFIVCNPKNYPLFFKLLNQIDVDLQPTEMSFGFFNKQTGFSYVGPSMVEFLRKPSNLFDPRFISFAVEQRSFNRAIRKDLLDGELVDCTLGEYFKERRVSKFLVTNYIAPLIASIWSSPEINVERFPAHTFATFFYNHSMLDFRGRPQWYTVVNGSASYVKAIIKNFQGEIKVNTPVLRIDRDADGISVLTSAGSQFFDKVIFAAHADQSLALISQPTSIERALLGSWRYSKNRAVLHSESSILPTRKRHWAAWNYSYSADNSQQDVSITYYMNRLQRIDSKSDFFVTLNPTTEIDGRNVHYEVLYEHPVYTPESVKTQSELQKIQGENHTYFCGAHLGYGFHEDGARSAVEVVKHFGIEL